MNAQTSHLDVTSERVGHQIDRVPELDERADAVVFAERGAPGLEKRLRGDHEDVQAQTSSLERHGSAVNVGPPVVDSPTTGIVPSGVAPIDIASVRRRRGD